MGVCCWSYSEDNWKRFSHWQDALSMKCHSTNSVQLWKDWKEMIHAGNTGHRSHPSSSHQMTSEGKDNAQFMLTLHCQHPPTYRQVHFTYPAIMTQWQFHHSVSRARENKMTSSSKKVWRSLQPIPHSPCDDKCTDIRTVRETYGQMEWNYNSIDCACVLYLTVKTGHQLNIITQ